MQITIKKGSPIPLGVSQCDGGINFAVAVPDPKSCLLNLYKKDTNKKTMAIPIEAEDMAGDIRCINLQGLEYKDYEYTYEIEGREEPDWYAGELSKEGSGKGVVAACRRCGFSFGDYNWKKDKNPRIPLNEIVLYRVHVRGFTKHASSGVTAAGTFLGVMEKIPYLKKLGINQIEVMPIYEFEEDLEEISIEQSGHELQKKRKNYWGYAHKNYYFAPKKKYAYSKEVQVELKNLIRELHANEMEFIMEVYFPGQNSASLMLDCLRFWVLNYHVDGFHLTGESIPLEAVTMDPFFSKTKIYYDRMNENAQRKTNKNVQAQKYLVQSTDDYLVHMRRFLKGDHNGLEQAAYYMRRNEEWFGYVNYFTSHNGFTMYDMVSYEEKHNEANLEDNQDGWNENYTWNCGVEGKTKRAKIQRLRLRQMKNAWLLLLLSQGIPAIMAGDEHCNSQNGNNNAYCQDNAIGWINWKDNSGLESIPQFVQELMAFRKKHPILHQSQPLRVMDYKSLGYPDLSYHSDKAWYIRFQKEECCMGILYCGEYALEKEDDDYIYLALNLDWRKQKLALPKLPKGIHWHREFDTGSENTIEMQKIRDEECMIEVPERTCIVLTGR